MRYIFYWFIFLFILALACNAVEEPREVKPYQVQSTNLSGKDFFFSWMCGLDLSNKNLQDANFYHAILQNVDLQNSDLRHADLTAADLRGASLKNSNLSGAKLDDALLRWANFDGATLDPKWANVINILVTGQGNEANLDKMDLREVNFGSRPGRSSTADRFRCDRDMDRKMNAGLSFSLKNASMRESNLEEIILGHGDLEGADLSGANLRGADLFRLNLANTNLEHADITSSTLSFVNLKGALVTSHQLKTISSLHCVILPDGKLSGVDYPEGFCKKETESANCVRLPEDIEIPTPSYNLNDACTELYSMWKEDE